MSMVKCAVAGCNRSVLTKSLCSAHYTRLRRKGDVGSEPVKVKAGPTVCAVPGCEQIAKSRGWCQMHYTRWQRSGEPGTAETRLRESCCVEGCDQKHYGNGYCASHWRQVRIYGEIGPKRIGRFRQDAYSLTYDGAHDRVERYRGPASTNICDQCGIKPAVDWAYDHCDVRELHTDAGYPYSVDISRYRPMCKACHKGFDVWVLGGRYRTRMIEESA